MPGVIQKQPLNQRAPVFQNFYKPPVCQGSRDYSLWHISDAESGKGRFGHDFWAVDGVAMSTELD